MNMDDTFQAFIIESRELLELMEEALLRIEQMPDDVDTINAIFRAAHTIKGSAGLFALDAIIQFTHVAENVLDKVRCGELHMDKGLVALLLDTHDHIETLIDAAATGSEVGESGREIGNALVARLESLTKPAQRLQAEIPLEKECDRETMSGTAADTDNWHLSLRFGQDVLRSGLDPLSFIRYLKTFGEIVSIVVLSDAIPPLSELDPESCYLGFEINFRSTADKTAIEGAFEFVRDGSEIRVLPPHSKVTEYLQLIGGMSDEAQLLGEILIRCGTLTQYELDDALHQQEVLQKQGKPCLIGEVLVNQNLVSPKVVNAALEKQKQAKDPKCNEASLIRIDAAKLDELINLVGELIIASAGANVMAQRVGASELIESIAVLSRLVEEVRDAALNLRMVQIGATFNRFQRLVHDVGKELGKDVNLVICGADTELDKTVVEKISDPLTHLIRNALDHGIESAERRLATGKPIQGTLKLNAFHDAGSIVIEVSDDGGGLPKDKILGKAIERGLITESQGLSDTDIFNLIFEPGFSTADQVSNISGRGVGMDVVKKNIMALRGTVELSSKEGQGTTVRIRLPLTLAIIDGFLIGVGSSVYVVPLDMVVECIELPIDCSSRDAHKYLNLRGEVLPFVRLRDLFEVNDQTVRRENVVVVQAAGHRAGLVVDELMGEFQTVIKPLGKMFGHTRGLGGFTILGNGEVALILDVQGLLHQIVHVDGLRHGAGLVPAGEAKTLRFNMQ